MRALNRVFRAKTINTQRRGVAFSIRQLFANSEPGVWYDPSDFSTMFQDAAGTVPVTAVEQPVGLMLDKSKGLTLGPELVTNGAFDTDTWWSKGSNCTIADGVGVASGAANESGWYRIEFVTVGKYYEITFTVVSISSGGFKVGFIGGPGTVRSQPGTYTVRILASGTAFGILTSGANTTGTIDNISVRELPGNHAYQTTATSRPVLSARYNLLTKTEQFDDAAWVKAVSSGTLTVIANNQTAPDGTTTADTIQTTAASNARLQQASPSIVGASYRASIWVKHISGTNTFAMFDANSNTVVNYTATSDWVLYTLDFTASSTSGGYFVRFVQMPADGAFAVWGASLVQTDQSHLPYQRVNTATDYDTTGFPAYLRFDGVDDWLVTPTITPGIDKVQVFAGVRKLSDAAAGIIAELSADFNTSSGSFYLVNADSLGRLWSSISRGSASPSSVQGSFDTVAAPDTAVISATHDIDGDLSTIRRNGVAGTSGTGDKGTGNFLAYPLYIGRRGGTSVPFNGHIYSLIVRFGANLPAATIENTENYINGLTKAY